MARRKLYITGAAGALYDGASPDGSRCHSSIQLIHQAYGRPYQLPNITAYNESCATIGLILWNWRMLAITGEAKYADLVELALYNGLLSTISLDGKRFFSTNPLGRMDELPFELRWSRRREPYITCFCCPPNTARTIAEVAGYAYRLSDKGLQINLYGGNQLHTHLADGSPLRPTRQTYYPWEGTIGITPKEAPQRELSTFLRVPGWARNACIVVNRETVSGNPESGHYHEVRRLWRDGDRIELILPKAARLMEAHSLVGCFVGRGSRWMAFGRELQSHRPKNLNLYIAEPGWLSTVPAMCDGRDGALTNRDHI